MDAANNSVYEAIQFTRKADNANEEYLYINPMLFTHISKNPFIQADRVMPIDLPQAYMYTVTNTLILPEGYQIEEIPKSQVYITEKNWRIVLRRSMPRTSMAANIWTAIMSIST